MSQLGSKRLNTPKSLEFKVSRLEYSNTDVFRVLRVLVMIAILSELCPSSLVYREIMCLFAYIELI